MNERECTCATVCEKNERESNRERKKDRQREIEDKMRKCMCV